MKKIFVLLLILVLAGCRSMNVTVPTVPAATVAVSPTAEPQAEPADAADPGPVEYAFTFTAQTLEGEDVTEEVFGRYDLTMVNVWASWCGPCKSELPELAELYGKLPENVGFLSITVDDPQDVKEAKALLEENGCTFPCLDSQTSTGLFKNFLGKVNAIPTTVFFDRSGNEVGGWILGVPQGGDSVSDAYLQQIQNRLDQLNGK